MDRLPYEEMEEDLIFRDYLAVDRTRMANERTMLGYIRTCVGLLAAGAGLVKFVDDLPFNVTGYVLLAICPLVLVLGFWRFMELGRKLKRLESPTRAQKKEK